MRVMAGSLACPVHTFPPSLRTQTYFRLSLVSAEKYVFYVFFGEDKRQPEVGLRSQANFLPAYHPTPTPTPTDECGTFKECSSV